MISGDSDRKRGIGVRAMAGLRWWYDLPVHPTRRQQIDPTLCKSFETELF